MCLFCGRECQTDRGQRRYTIYKCPCCGTHGVSDFFNATTELADDTKIKISHMLTEHRLMEKKPLILTADSNKEEDDVYWKSMTSLLGDYPKSPLEFLDRAFLNLSRMIHRPAEVIKFPINQPEILFARNADEVEYVLRQLSNSGFISMFGVVLLRRELNIEAKGWERLSNLQRTAAGNTNQVFIAMWFNECMDTFYFEGIKKAIEYFEGLKAFRIDSSEHNNKICDQIIAEIKKS